MFVDGRCDRSTPQWLQLRRGNSHVIVVAPHGGRRRRRIRRGDGVNDLYTAQIAAELALRLDAHALINRSLDRNEVDLNRISQLCSAAPEFLDHLGDAIDDVRSRQRIPLLLFVHGWNMVLPCCDLGFGVRARGGRLHGRHPTLSRACFHGTVAALSRALAARGLEAAIGLRYPGSGSDNALQLFSGRHFDSPDARVARLSRMASEGQVDALQMELAIPLRWPGPRRRAFVDAVVDALGEQTVGAPQERGQEAPQASSPCSPADPSAPGADPAGHAADRSRGQRLAADQGSARSEWELERSVRPEKRVRASASAVTLQAILKPQPGAGTTAGATGLFAGVEAQAADGFAARICLVRADGTMLLFVTEGHWDSAPGRFAAGGLHWQVCNERDGAAAVDVRYRGPMVAYGTHDAYEDLEIGLANSVLSEAGLQLSFKSDVGLGAAGAGVFGRLAYTIDVDGCRQRGEVFAVLGYGPRTGMDGAAKGRVFVTAGVDRPLAAIGPEAVVFVDDDQGRVAGIEIRGRGRLGLRGPVTARVPVWRQAPDGSPLRLTFGVARLARHDDGADDATGKAQQACIHALFDRLEVFRRSR